MMTREKVATDEEEKTLYSTILFLFFIDDILINYWFNNKIK